MLTDGMRLRRVLLVLALCSCAAMPCVSGSLMKVAEYDSAAAQGSVIVAQIASSPQQFNVFSTVGYPTLAVLRGGLPLPLPDTGTWDKAAIDSRTFSQTTLGPIMTGVDYAAAAVLESLIVFDDNDNQARISPSNILFTIDLSSLAWNTPVVSQDAATIKLVSNDSRLTMDIAIRSTNNQDALLPHLLFNPDSFTIAFTLNTSYYNFTTETAKIGVSWRVASSDSQIKYSETKTIDDERAPSIFIYNSVLFGSKQGYLQWNPVYYGDEHRTMANGSIVHFYGLENAAAWSDAKRCIGSSLFNDVVLQSHRANMSFGYDHDKTFTPQLTVWSMVMGNGQPRPPFFSKELIVTIIVTTAMPIVGFVFGGIYRMCKRRRAEGSSYTAIQ